MESGLTVSQTREERRVLVVDDDPDFAGSIADILKSHGYCSAVASGAQEALSTIPDFDARVALVDLRLGSENGLNLVSDLKQTRPDMLCVMMSACADVESAMRALREGAYAYLRKPVDGNELLATLERCFEKIQLQHDKAATEEALRIANTQLEEKNRRLADLAATDALTGLYNRRQFLEMLRRECLRGRRHDTATSLVVVDVDHFKAINDEYGHTFGDDVLVKVANTLKERARATDIVARYGGDEFMILMPVTDDQQAFVGAERIRKKVAQRVVSERGRSHPVSISLGIGSLGADETGTPEDLIDRADEALHEAKTTGRDCTRTWRQAHGPDASGAEASPQQKAIESLQHRLETLSDLSKETFLRSIQSLAIAQEARDPYAKRHSENVARYATGIAETMGLDPEQVEIIRRAAMMHDIGKIGVPDAVFQKPGPLTPQEKTIMEQHVLIGTRMLDRLGFLGLEIPIIRHHHERWDGKGYPDGIAGNGIPPGARLLAVADAFDAITSDRVYRRARDLPTAMGVLSEESGRQFNPAAVDAMAQWLRESTRNESNSRPTAS